MSTTESPQRSRVRRALSRVGFGLFVLVVAVVAAVVTAAAIDVAARLF